MADCKLSVDIECLDQVSIVMLSKFQSSVNQDFHQY